LFWGRRGRGIILSPEIQNAFVLFVGDLQDAVNRKKKCSDFGKMKCSKFGNKSTVFSGTTLQ